MKIKYIVITLIILGFGALVFYRISENKKLEAKGGPGGGPGGKGGPAGKGGPGGGMPAMRVNGIVVQPQEFANTLSVTGSIEANEQVEIRGRSFRAVRSISFQEGSNVKKGQVLVKDRRY